MSTSDRPSSPHERACALFPIEETGNITRPYILHTPCGEDVFHSREAAEARRNDVAMPIAVAIMEAQNEAFETAWQQARQEIAAAQRGARAAILSMVEEACDARSRRDDELFADGMNEEAACQREAAEALYELAESIRRIDDPSQDGDEQPRR